MSDENKIEQGNLDLLWNSENSEEKENIVVTSEEEVIKDETDEALTQIQAVDEVIFEEVEDVHQGNEEIEIIVEDEVDEVCHIEELEESPLVKNNQEDIDLFDNEETVEVEIPTEVPTLQSSTVIIGNNEVVKEETKPEPVTDVKETIQLSNGASTTTATSTPTPDKDITEKEKATASAEDGLQLSNGTTPTVLSNKTYKLKTDLNPVKKLTKSTEEVTEKVAEPIKNSKTMSLGSRLKEERLQKKMSIETVSEITHINQAVISYIEAEDFENAPAPVFTRSYIKKLAELYGQSSKEDLLAEYEAIIEAQRNNKPISNTDMKVPDVVDENTELNDYFSKVTGAPPSIVDTGNKSSGMIKLAILVGIVVVVGYFALSVYQAREKSQATATLDTKLDPVVTAPAIELKDIEKYSTPVKPTALTLEIPTK